jgi:hypothetical protein
VSTQASHQALPLDPDSPRPTTGRFVYGIALILTFTAIYSCYCGTPMIYDGAAQFAGTVYSQTPFVYQSRFHTYILWQPTVWLSKVTENLNVLIAAYGLPFLLAPVVGVMVSWWVVGRHAPGLILWALFGILAAPLPGQIFVINDTIFQQHLFWPIFLAMFVPLTWPKRVVLAVLVVFQFPHQVGAVLLTGAAGAAFAAALLERDRARRNQALAKAGIVFVVALLAWSKVYGTSIPGQKYYDSYAAEEIREEAWRQRWIGGVMGLPLYGQIGMWASAVLAFAAARCFERGSDDRANGWRRAGQALAAAAFVSAMAGGAVWIRWASNERFWAFALEYRRWVVPLAMPHYLLCFLEGCLYVRRSRTSLGEAEPALARHPASLTPGRVPLGYLLAGVFAMVISLQAVTWAGLMRRLMADVRSYPGTFVPQERVSWSLRTPLEHWGVPSYVMALQGKRPAKLLIGADVTQKDLEILYLPPPNGPFVPLGHWFLLPAWPGPAGYYDHRPLTDPLRPPAKEKPKTQPAPSATQPDSPP